MTKTTNRSTAPATRKSPKRATATPAPAPAPAADATPTPVCAFCGEGREPKREPLLPAALYIASLAVEPPHDSTVAHLSCARAHREARDASLTQRAPRASRRTAAPTVPQDPPFVMTTARATALAMTDGSARITFRLKRLAALALGLDQPDAWGRLVQCTFVGSDARGSAVIVAKRVVSEMILDAARRIHAGTLAMHPTPAQHQSSARSSVRVSIPVIEHAVANAGDVFTF